MKNKETLEEASHKYALSRELNKTSHLIGFREGAKWQQEISYSEEEVIELTNWYLDIFLDDAYLEGFENGKNWQQEKMYSEEEVGELLYNVIGEYGKHYGIMIDGKMLNDLFEQFKKK